MLPVVLPPVVVPMLPVVPVVLPVVPPVLPVVPPLVLPVVPAPLALPALSAMPALLGASMRGESCSCWAVVSGLPLPAWYVSSVVWLRQEPSVAVSSAAAAAMERRRFMGKE
ncbi:hypothetical protein F1C16_15035 [Hymenobacter sp. NBH84]|nr:hypothetical protein F1C16_15035 [Hymenobacter sp. NBH84]